MFVGTPIADLDLICVINERLHEVYYALDRLVQPSREAQLDAYSVDHQSDLDDSVSDHWRDIWVCFRPSISRPDRESKTWPFAINLVANLLFMPLFVGVQNIPLATLDIMLVWVTIIGCMIVIWPHYRWVAIAQVPYLIWVSTATVLQVSILAMNWKTS